MVSARYVPRINNNDDEVKILAFEVSKGDRVRAEQVIGQVETDKAVLDVVATQDGYVLGFVGQSEEVVKVGSVMLWLGETPDETIPEVSASEAGSAGQRVSQITAKARILLSKHGLKSEAIAPINGRITVEAVECHLALLGVKGQEADSREPGYAKQSDVFPSVKGASVALSRAEKGMALTVAWHREFAVPGYIEIEYDLAPWAEYAKRFQEEKGLLLPPLLPLMAWRLICVAHDTPRLNATFVDNMRYEYDPVNLGFTIQSGESLYLAVVRGADGMNELGFVNALGDTLRRAAGHNLHESEVSGATIGFSSMERWKVTRHMPILPPHTALMVAHAAGRDGKAVLGASYDHRVLNGGQVVAALKKLSSPRID